MNLSPLEIDEKRIDIRLAITRFILRLTGSTKFAPVVIKDWKYLNRFSTPNPGRCITCKKLHGKIITYYQYEEYLANYMPEMYVMAHDSPFFQHINCLCYFSYMQSIVPGTATINSKDGADYTLTYDGKLPEYYISKEYARENGWEPISGNLSKVLPGKMIGGNIFSNKEKKLPEKEGRVWYEADINYISGMRSSHRILYSNDGMVFVTYDHYNTFFLISDEK